MGRSRKFNNGDIVSPILSKIESNKTRVLLENEIKKDNMFEVISFEINGTSRKYLVESTSGKKFRLLSKDLSLADESTLSNKNKTRSKFKEGDIVTLNNSLIKKYISKKFLEAIEIHKNWIVYEIVKPNNSPTRCLIQAIGTDIRFLIPEAQLVKVFDTSDVNKTEELSQKNWKSEIEKRKEIIRKNQAIIAWIEINKRVPTSTDLEFVKKTFEIVKSC